MPNGLKKAIAGLIIAASVASGSIAIDNAVVTDAEIHTSIETAIEQGKIPMIDLEKVSFDRLAKGYLDVANKYQVVLDEKAGQGDVYTLISDKKKEKGEIVSLRNNDTLLVK